MVLCPTCLKIPFPALFGTSRKPRAWTVGSLSLARRNSEYCRFCSFLVQAYELAYDLPQGDRATGSENVKLGFQILARESTRVKHEEPWFEQAGVVTKAKAGPALWLRFSDVEEPTEPLVCVSCVRARKTARGDQGSQSALVPRRRRSFEVTSCRLNYALVNQWLRICVEEHNGMCRQATDFKRKTLRLRLIDVLRRQITIVDNVKHYVALSYVWGDMAKQATIDFWQAVDPTAECIDLPVTLPQSIEDAITFTGEIKVQYLWVDAYCINQTDVNELQAQIANMHLVFECAFLTIAAMDGRDTAAGLCGISRNFKQLRQPQVTTEYGEFMATYVHAVWLRQGLSPWETRAWTLQEMALSRRILFFNENHVSMRCPSEYFHDLLEIDSQPGRPHFEQSNNYFWENGFAIRPYDAEWSFTRYDLLVANYTRRILTHQSDALSACLGGLNQIKRNTGVEFIQGLPRADLHLALLWKPHHHASLVRRQLFPSWSWLGWIGRIEYHYCLDELATYEELGPAEKHKRTTKRRRHDLLEQETVFRNDVAYITDGEDGILRVSSLAAQVRVRKVRRQGEAMKYLRKDSEQARNAAGDHWVVLDQSGTPLYNDIGEVARFEGNDYSFQVDPALSVDLYRAKGRCGLLFIKYFPWLRDHPIRGEARWLFSYIGCLVIIREPDDVRKATRIGSVFVRLEDWIALDPQLEVVSLV